MKNSYPGELPAEFLGTMILAQVITTPGSGFGPGSGLGSNPAGTQETRS